MQTTSKAFGIISKLVGELTGTLGPLAEWYTQEI